EEVQADAFAQLGRDRSSVLDRQVRDALSGVELALAHARARGTGVEAEAAAPASLHHRLVRLELGARHDRTEQAVRAEPRYDQAAVLPDESDAGALRPSALEHRQGVDAHPHFVAFVAQHPSELAGALADHVVVVAPARIARDDAGARPEGTA